MGKAHIMLRHVKTCGTTNGQEPSPIRPRFFLSFRLPVRHNLVISSTLAGAQRLSKPWATASHSTASCCRWAPHTNSCCTCQKHPQPKQTSTSGSSPELVMSAGVNDFHLAFSLFSLLNWHIPLGSCTSHLPTTVSNWMSQGTCSLEPLATSC